MAGDYLRFSPIYGMKKTKVTLPLINLVVLLAKSPVNAINVQRISFAPSAYMFGIIQFIDSISGFVIAQMTVPASAPSVGDGSSAIYIDFGPNGDALTIGANLIVAAFPGAAGNLTIQSFQSGPLYVVQPYVAPATAGTGI
jgi:hypothetical protein